MSVTESASRCRNCVEPLQQCRIMASQPARKAAGVPCRDFSARDFTRDVQTSRPSRILTGFSGTGKTVVCSSPNAWLEAADTDDHRTPRKSIPDIFARRRGALRPGVGSAGDRSATTMPLSPQGGVRPANRALMARSASSFRSAPETILRRLNDRAEDEPLTPLSPPATRVPHPRLAGPPAPARFATGRSTPTR
jgi:hypothetical protein